MANWKELKIGNLIAKTPVVQGGMGVGISLSGLASAVANEGGIGVISAALIGMLKPGFAKNCQENNVKALREEIRKARQRTKGILGVNIMVALSDFAEMVKTAVEEKIDVIFAGAGLPLNLPEFLTESSKTKLVPIVSSSRAAGIICKRWLKAYNYLPDAVVVEGPMAGGHLGFSSEQLDDPHCRLEELIPQVVEELRPWREVSGRQIPVIAAGGIYTGRDIHGIMKLGADGVQMGTRFVTTKECEASLEFKQSYIDSGENDTMIIKSPVGMPGRAIRNQFLEEAAQGQRHPFKCVYHCIKTCTLEKAPYCIAMALINAQKGNLKHGFAFAGSNAYRTQGLTSVRELIDNLGREYDEAWLQALEPMAAM